jgi:2,4-dienoyl-CoA reductase-like NADH-dependent reductase (Old Yellow Enzyme family)/pyruvate/2-oxoglutarate dehydrogenase complex dihydrolipoamide dehydrogenase (E3) component
MKRLFSPFHLKGLDLTNRIVMPGLASFLIEDDGTITEKTIEHYRRRAAGGPAMVIMEACAVSPEGIVSPHQARIYEDRFIEGISRIARVMKSEGAVPALQLHHGGRQTTAKIIKQKPVAPSNLPCPTIQGEVQALSVERIQELIVKFGEGAQRAVEAGFELIEIHGAHGYLVNQFLSRFSNIREDEYGGDLTGRTKFALEIVKEIRKRVGEAFPLSFKISAQEFVPKGLTVEESIQMLRLLSGEGIDIVQISAGNDATPEWICQPMFMKKACLADSAATIRKALNKPVMAVGRINDPVVANAIIAEGKADLVCMGRGLLADPELPLKAKEGRLDDIRHCIACNTCMESIFRRGRVECLVNPSLGREKEMELHPSHSPKRIMVIGGGPGGMNVAWIAAKRGHEVHLFEKQSALGGQLILGSVLNYKKELLSLMEYQKRQVEKSGVKCHLNVEVNLDAVKERHPDVVVLATGSTPIMPDIAGVDKSILYSFADVFNHDETAKRNTAVVGGGAIGCEIALHLSESGCAVTIVEQLPKIGGQLESVTKKVLLEKLKEGDLRMLVGHRLLRGEAKGVVVAGNGGRESWIEAERVVMAIGNKPDNALYDQIKSIGIEVYQIGDCLEPRSAEEAVNEGAPLVHE